MRANSPNAIFISLTLHAFVAAVLFVSTVYIAQQEKAPVIFELVAGPPTAPDELVAPALGNTAAPVKLEVPKVNLPPEPEPEAAPEPPVSETVTTKPATKPDTSIVKDMKKS